MKHYRQGFTLIELMIVVAIIGILAAIAIPNYSEYVKKSRRTDAMTAISAVQQAQEKWRANNVSYSAIFGSDGLNMPASPALAADAATYPSAEGYYNITFTGTPNSTSYTLVATAKGKQLADTKCTTLTLTVANGNATRSSSPNTSGCW